LNGVKDKIISITIIKVKNFTGSSIIDLASLKFSCREFVTSKGTNAGWSEAEVLDNFLCSIK